MEDFAPDTYVNTQECCFFSMGIIALKKSISNPFHYHWGKLSSGFVWSIAYQNYVIIKDLIYLKRRELESRKYCIDF